jgi:histone H3/H4
MKKKKRKKVVMRKKKRKKKGKKKRKKKKTTKTKTTKKVMKKIRRRTGQQRRVGQCADQVLHAVVERLHVDVERHAVECAQQVQRIGGWEVNPREKDRKKQLKRN